MGAMFFFFLSLCNLFYDAKIFLCVLMIIKKRKKNYKKNIRVERAFGSEYSLEKIRERIETTYARQMPNKNNTQS